MLWFKCLVFIIFGTLLYCVYRVRIAQLNRRQVVLQQLVDERTRALSDTIHKLETTQEQVIANAKHTALGRLVSGVAHELNTPLGIAHTAALMVVDSFEEVCISLEQNKLSEAILKRIRTKVVNSSDLLRKNFSRLSNLIDSFKLVSADQNTEQCREINLLSYLVDISRAHKNSLEENDIKLEVVGSDSISINTYPGAISSVINELLSNAIAHGFDIEEQNSLRTISVEISLAEHTNPVTNELEKMISIEVSNNGVPIPGELIDKIFDPFVSGQSGTNAVGLGLHIAYNIVTHQLKGAVHCAGSNHDETRFVVRFPAVQFSYARSSKLVQGAQCGANDFCLTVVRLGLCSDIPPKTNNIICYSIKAIPVRF